MVENIFMFLLIVFVSNGIFASDTPNAKFLLLKEKFYPKRSSLFEPNCDLDVEQDLIIEDLEKGTNREFFDEITPIVGNYYYSKSKLPWNYGAMKQRDSLLSNINVAIMEDDDSKLQGLLPRQDFSKINKFDENPLVAAVLFNRVSMIAPLIAAGANINIKDEEGEDIITLAYKNSNQAMVQELLKAQKAHIIHFGKLNPMRTASVSPYDFDSHND